MLTPLVQSMMNEIRKKETYSTYSDEQIIHAALISLIQKDNYVHFDAGRDPSVVSQVMASLGRKTSERKKKSSAENGKKGALARKAKARQKHAGLELPWSDGSTT